MDEAELSSACSRGNTDGTEVSCSLETVVLRPCMWRFDKEGEGCRAGTTRREDDTLVPPAPGRLERDVFRERGVCDIFISLWVVSSYLCMKQ